MPCVIYISYTASACVTGQSHSQQPVRQVKRDTCNAVINIHYNFFNLLLALMCNAQLRLYFAACL